MSRRLLALALGSSLFILGVVAGQDAKPQPPAKAKAPAKPRIAIDDPAKLKDDADFVIQGEYVGEVVNESGASAVGVQVVALGGGEFSVVSYPGGLPGAGWNGNSVHSSKAVRESGKVVIRTSTGDPLGEITDSAIVLRSGERTRELKRKVRTSPTIGAKPPEGAEVLFAQPGDEANWTNGKLRELSDGKFLNYGIKSKKTFGSFKAHVEFRLPWMPNSRGQQRANSGVYLQDRYEVQVLDSFGLKGENNECGGIYQQYKPLVNMCLPPMVWQTYDIDFTAATYEGSKKTAPAKLTLKHNGVLIHDNIEFKGSTGGGQPEAATPGPIQLQNHGDPLVFRNIWVVAK